MVDKSIIQHPINLFLVFDVLDVCLEVVAIVVLFLPLVVN